MAFGAGVRLRERNGILEQKQAIQAIPVEMKKLSVQASARNMGTVSREAANRFHASILRRGETGEGAGRRQTGNFEFGQSRGGAFQGSSFEIEKGIYGFGWPDIDRADDATDFVWRSLEYGLQGTRANQNGVLRGPPRAIFSENQHLAPTGYHKMPKRYEFTSADPGSSTLVPGVSRDGFDRPPGGAGIEGKHFIEEAWLASKEIISRRYVKVVTDAIATYGN